MSDQRRDNGGVQTLENWEVSWAKLIMLIQK